MQDIQLFERCLKDFKYVADFKRFQFPNDKSHLKPLRIKKKRIKRFNPLSDLNENQFRLKYRYTKENFRRIIEIVRDDLEIDLYEPMKKDQVPIDMQILAAIRFWGGTEHPELTAMAHGVSLRTMAKITKRVASVLSSKASRYIRMPATLSEKERIMRSFQELANMPQVIGALVQTTVRYGGTDAEELLHLQVVCDADHKIRDLDLRLPEELSMSPTASEMYCLSRIKERFEQNEFRGRIILGNETLTCSPSLFTPVPYPNSLSEDLYNQAHEVTFGPARKCLSAWIKRFGILKTEIWGSFGLAKQTITALALLHNMAMEWNDPSIVDTPALYMPTFLSSMYETNPSQTGEQRNRKQFIETHFGCS